MELELEPLDAIFFGAGIGIVGTIKSELDPWPEYFHAGAGTGARDKNFHAPYRQCKNMAVITWPNPTFLSS